MWRKFILVLRISIEAVKKFLKPVQFLTVYYVIKKNQILIAFTSVHIIPLHVTFTYLLHATFSVLYCVKMWCILRTLPRSTRHSAVDCPTSDITHCPPLVERSEYRPSTASSAPQIRILKGFSCHAGLLNAMFSVNSIKKDRFCKIQNVSIDSIYFSKEIHHFFSLNNRSLQEQQFFSKLL